MIRTRQRKFGKNGFVELNDFYDRDTNPQYTWWYAWLDAHAAAIAAGHNTVRITNFPVNASGTQEYFFESDGSSDRENSFAFQPGVRVVGSRGNKPRIVRGTNLGTNLLSPTRRLFVIPDGCDDLLVRDLIIDMNGFRAGGDAGIYADTGDLSGVQIKRLDFVDTGSGSHQDGQDDYSIRWDVDGSHSSVLIADCYHNCPEMQFLGGFRASGSDLDGFYVMGNWTRSGRTEAFSVPQEETVLAPGFSTASNIQYIGNRMNNMWGGGILAGAAGDPSAGTKLIMNDFVFKYNEITIDTVATDYDTQSAIKIQVGDSSDSVFTGVIAHNTVLGNNMNYRRYMNGLEISNNQVAMPDSPGTIDVDIYQNNFADGIVRLDHIPRDNVQISGNGASVVYPDSTRHCLHFRSESQTSIDTNIDGDLDLTGQFSIAAWLFLVNWKDHDKEISIARKGDGTNSPFQWFLRSGKDSHNQRFYSSALASHTVDSDFRFTDDPEDFDPLGPDEDVDYVFRWIHLCMTVAGTEDAVRFYINGRLDTSTGNTGNISTRAASTGNLIIGANPDEDDHFADFCLADFRIFNQVLSGAEVLTLKGGDRPGTGSDPYNPLYSLQNTGSMGSVAVNANSILTQSATINTLHSLDNVYVLGQKGSGYSPDPSIYSSEYTSEYA